MNNWERDFDNPLYQNLETEYGKLTLELMYGSDRGNFRFTTMLKPGAHNRFFDLISMYYFSEEVAKEEISNWLEIFQKIDLIQPPKGISLRAEYLLHARHCMLTRGRVDFGISDLLPYYFNVITTKELEFILSVDYSDQIPRLFMNKDNANIEAQGWLQVREQAADFSKWEKLA